MSKYVVFSSGTVIGSRFTARGANELLELLGSSSSSVDMSREEDVVSMMRREGAVVGVDPLIDFPSISLLMKRFSELPLNDPRYFSYLNEIVFWIPIVTRMSWGEMAVAYLESLGWEDEELRETKTVPDILLGKS